MPRTVPFSHSIYPTNLGVNGKRRQIMARVGLWTVDSHFNPVEDFCQFDITRELVQSSLRSSSVKLWAHVRSLSAGQVAKTTQTPPFGVLQARQHEEVAIIIWGLPSGCGISQQGVFFPSLKEGAATQPESVLLLLVTAFL